MNKLSLILTLSLVSTGTVMAAGDATAGRQLAETCLGCHAGKLTNASPKYHVPKLGGQHPEYIISALKSYRAEQRYHPTMRANAAQLSDEDIANIAAFMASYE